MTNAKKLDRFLDNIPHAKYVETLNLLTDYLKITYNILYNYRKGITSMKKSTRDSIEQFFKQNIF